MGDTRRYNGNAVERKQRMARSGKLPKDGGSRRSDLIRAIADDLTDEYGGDDQDEFVPGKGMPQGIDAECVCGHDPRFPLGMRVVAMTEYTKCADFYARMK